MLYRCLTGQHHLGLPEGVRAEDASRFFKTPVHIPARGVPKPLEPVLQRALAPAPEDRYASVDEFREDLARAAKELD